MYYNYYDDVSFIDPSESEETPEPSPVRSPEPLPAMEESEFKDCITRNEAWNDSQGGNHHLSGDNSELSPEPIQIRLKPEPLPEMPSVGSDYFSTSSDYQQQQPQSDFSRKDNYRSKEADHTSSLPFISPMSPQIFTDKKLVQQQQVKMISERKMVLDQKTGEEEASPPVDEVFLSESFSYRQTTVNDEESDTFLEDRSLERRLHHVLSKKTPATPNFRQLNISKNKQSESDADDNEQSRSLHKKDDANTIYACLSRAAKELYLANKRLQQKHKTSLSQQLSTHVPADGENASPEPSPFSSIASDSEQYNEEALRKYTSTKNICDGIAPRDHATELPEEEENDLALKVRRSIQAEEEMRKERDAMSSELEKTKKKIENEKVALFSINEKNSVLEEENTKVKLQNNVLSDEVELLKEDIESLNKLLAAEVSRCDNSKQEAIKQVTHLRNELCQAKNQLDEKIQALHEMTELKMSLEEEATESSRRILILNDELESLQVKVDELIETNDGVKVELDRVVKENFSNQKIISSLQKRVEEHEHTITAQSEVVKTKDKLIEKLKEEFNNRVNALKLENESILANNNSLRVDLEAATEKMLNLSKEKSKGGLIEPSNDYSIVSASDRLSRIRLRTERAALLKEHQREITQLIADRDAEMKRLTDLLDDEKKERERAHSDLMAQMKKEKQQLQSDFERKLIKEQQEARERVTAATGSVEVAMAQLASLEKKNKREITKKEEISKKLDQVNEKHQTDKDELIEQHNAEIKSLRDKWYREKETLLAIVQNECNTSGPTFKSSPTLVPNALFEYSGLQKNSTEFAQQSPLVMAASPLSPRTVTKGPISFSELDKSLCETEAFIQSIFNNN